MSAITTKITGSSQTITIGGRSFATGVLWSFQGLTGTGTRNFVLSLANYGSTTGNYPVTATNILSHFLWGRWAGPGDATAFFPQAYNFYHPLHWELESNSILNCNGTLQGGDIVLLTIYFK